MSTAYPAYPSPASTAATKVPAVIQQLATSPYTSWVTSSVLLAALPLVVKNPVGFPHIIQLPAFALAWSGGGYIIKEGDALNGSGTTTAWSLIYLFFNGKKALQARRPGPIGLCGVAAAQASVFGWYYFSQ